MIDLPHSSKSADHDEPDTTETSNDPRNNADETYDDMATTTIDSAHNMPGDQPEDDSPPSPEVANGTREPDES